MMGDGGRNSLGLPPLSSLVQRPEVRDIWYNGKSLVLDGFTFLSCRFDNCDLHVASPHFEMRQCFLDENTRIFYRGNIVKLLRLFNSRYDWVYEEMPYFAPEKHDDGTVSIVME